MLAERLIGLQSDVHAGTARDVVDDHRCFDLIGDGRVMLDQAGLRAFVVVRRDEQERVRADGGGHPAHFQRVGGGVAAGSGNDLAAARRIIHSVGNKGQLLLRGERCGFAGRAADDNGVDAAADLAIHKLL